MGNTALQSNNSFFQQGRFLYEQREYQKAIGYFDTSIQRNKNLLDAYKYKSLCFYKLYEFSKAIECLDIIISLTVPVLDQDGSIKKNIDAHYIKVQIYNYSNKYEEAMECCNSILQFNPREIKALCIKGQILTKCKRYLDALECYDSALGFDPKNVDLYYMKAHILKELYKYTDAIDCYKSVLQFKPGDVKSKDSIKGILKYLYQIEPGQRILNKIKGEELIKLELYSDAIEFYKTLITYGLTDLDYYNSMAFCFMKLSNFKKAIKYYSKVIRLEATPELYLNCGKACAKMGDYLTTIKYCNKALDKDRKFSSAYKLKAYALKNCGEFKDANHNIHILTLLEPNNPDIYYDKANNLLALKKIRESEVCIRIFTELNYAKLYNQSLFVKKQGDYGKAVELFNNLISCYDYSNTGVLVNKILCKICEDQKINIKNLDASGNDKLAHEIFNGLKLLQQFRDGNKLVSKKILFSSQEYVIEQENSSESKDDFVFMDDISDSDLFSSDTNIDIVTEYRSNNLSLVRTIKEEIKNFILPQDYTSSKYKISLKFKDNNSLGNKYFSKEYYGYKIGLNEIKGYNYWGVLDVDFKQDASVASRVTRVLKNSINTGIKYNCRDGIKCMYYTKDSNPVYEIKIYNSDIRVYSDLIAQSLLNKVIVFNNLGDHSDVRSFLKTNIDSKHEVVLNYICEIDENVDYLDLVGVSEI